MDRLSPLQKAIQKGIMVRAEVFHGIACCHSLPRFFSGLGSKSPFHGSYRNTKAANAASTTLAAYSFSSSFGLQFPDQVWLS